MSDDAQSLLLFNLATMSGVSPGVRTQIMQRVQLQALDGDAAHGRWARLLWYADPSLTTQAILIDGATCAVQLQAAPGADRWDEAPVAVLEAVESATLNREMAARLAQHAVRARVCGGCRHWQADGVRLGHGLPAGTCTWRTDAPGAPDTPTPLARQSLFAPACSHWAVNPEPPAVSPVDAPPAVVELPRAAVLEKQEEAARSWRGRLRGLLGRRDTPAPAPLTWGERLVERSGVGAGTEPCFACQGRIANLGALTVDTDEGDKHTYSVWRCRACHTTYLNSWIDRWERLDSLETEETYYRIAPAEAVEVLAVIDGVVGGEHPAGRHTRAAERAWFEAFVRDRRPLSHQRKQGR
ncbi:MAG: hypothetical protein KDE20_03535 [Caldilineaceae bacterium]|nr:hypothetical protein [Caldilineaceae bacterium]